MNRSKNGIGVIRTLRSLGLVRAVFLCLALVAARTSGAQSCTAQDADCDGIPDRTERRLLEIYRPYYSFSRDNGDNETFRPTDVRVYLRSAEIDGTGNEGEKVLLSNSNLVRDLNQLINLQVNGDHSSLKSTPKRTSYFINPDNEIGRRGAPWDQVLASKKIGLYGHVVPVRLASAEQYDRNHVPSSADAQLPLFYKIEYWQFFGYSSNNKPLDMGDHEGDWDTVQLIYKPGVPGANVPASLKTVLFYAHGKEMAFDLSAETGSVIMDNGMVREIRGSQYNMPVPNLRDEGAEAKARNHVLRLYKDPLSGHFTHPVVFVEHGGHEFWPSPYWEYTGAQKHGGDDQTHSYLTATPPNLGEVEYPLNEEPLAAVIMQFNGRWGTYSRELPGIFTNNPPPGSALHYEWTWPASSSIRWQLQGIEY